MDKWRIMGASQRGRLLSAPPSGATEAVPVASFRLRLLGPQLSDIPSPGAPVSSTLCSIRSHPRGPRSSCGRPLQSVSSPGHPLTWDGTTAASGPPFSRDVGSGAPGRGQSGCWAFLGLPGPAFPCVPALAPRRCPGCRRVLSMLVARVPLPPPCPGAPAALRHRPEAERLLG